MLFCHHITTTLSSLSLSAISPQPTAPTAPLQFGEPGDKFDPNVHEALFEYEDKEMEPGTLGQVLKIGYMFKDRCLRPAQAGTIKAPPS